MTDKTEAQPEALRLEVHQECADFATSLRSAANVVQLQGQKAPPSFLKAADIFERAASEIQRLKAQLSARQAVVPDGFVSIYESNARGIFAQTPTKMHGGPEHNWRPVAFIDAETDALGLPLPPPEREPLSDDQWQALADALDGIINRELKDKISTILQLPTE